MSIELGEKPDSLVVWLSRFSDFDAGLELTDTSGAPIDWPVGLGVDLRFYADKVADHAVSWSAAEALDLRAWYKTRSTVETTVLIPRLKVARLILLPSGGGEKEWYSGTVRNAH